LRKPAYIRLINRRFAARSAVSALENAPALEIKDVCMRGPIHVRASTAGRARRQLEVHGHCGQAWALRPTPPPRGTFKSSRGVVRPKIRENEKTKKNLEWSIHIRVEKRSAFHHASPTVHQSRLPKHTASARPAYLP
jgi:hypothetical protein